MSENPRPSWPYLAHRRAQLPRVAPRLPGALAGPRTASGRGRIRPRGQPSLERSTPGRSGWRSSRGGTSASWRSPSCSGSRSARSSRACGAFPVRRGERDLEAVETAIRLCREGHIVVMFPEGTRREKGLRKRHEARWRSGAARIALEAGVPLVPAGIAGTDGARATSAKLKVVFGDPIALDDLADDVRRRRRPCSPPTGSARTITELEASLR